MKKIFQFGCILFIGGIAQAKQVTLDLPDDEIKIIENYVPDAVQWLKDEWAGRVQNSKDTMVKEEIDRSRKSQEAIPAGDQAIVDKVFVDPNYKSRKDKDISIKIAP